MNLFKIPIKYIIKKILNCIFLFVFKQSNKMQNLNIGSKTYTRKEYNLTVGSKTVYIGRKIQCKI